MAATRIFSQCDRENDANPASLAHGWTALYDEEASRIGARRHSLTRLNPVIACEYPISGVV
jgi:hypothetical protein